MERASAHGLDLTAVGAHKDETGSVVGMSGTKPLGHREILEVPCHILVPAAIETQITAANAGDVQTRLVVEAANGPTTPEADRILAERGIAVLPDILANAGGVIVSYFEWVQNLDNQQWEEHEVLTRLQKKMYRATEQVVTRRAALIQGLPEYRATWAKAQPQAEEIPVPDLRTAAYTIAIDRLRQATTQRGVWP